MSWRLVKAYALTKVLVWISKITNQPIFMKEQKNQSLIVRKKMKDFTFVNYSCPMCKDGFMIWQQQSEIDKCFRTTYFHECDNCSCKMNLSLAYPHKECDYTK